MQNKLPLFPAVVALLFLLAGFVLYGSAGHDDSHITFWASYTLDHFGEILNYNGERIEQSSSLLLTLLVAFIAKVTSQDVVIVGYSVTYASGAVALFLCWQLALRLLPEEHHARVAILLLATSPAFLLWNTSGMESTLTAVCLLNFILVWGDLLSDNSPPTPRAVGWALLATLMLITVRPEMVMLVSALVFVVAIYRRVHGLRGHVGIIVFYSTVLLSICSVIGFRFFYFGSPVPLPVFAKVSAFSTQRLTDGIVYLLRYGFSNMVFTVGVILAAKRLFFLLRKTPAHPLNFHSLLCIGILLIYTAFIALTGGDWMQAGRFLVPVLPLAALVCATSLARTFATRLQSLAIIAVTAIVIVNIAFNIFAIKDESHGIPLWASYHISPKHQQRYSLFEQFNQEHLRDMEVIDTLDNTIATLQAKNVQPVSLLSGQSGMVFFYTAKKYFRTVHFIDNRGLTDNALLTCRRMDDVPRSSQGLYFDFDGFFARQPGLADDCHLPKPDILYDINDMTRQLPQRMVAQGYTLIHTEGGKMVDNSTPLPAHTLPAANFVMVANDLLPDLPDSTTKIIRYRDEPLVHRFP